MQSGVDQCRENCNSAAQRLQIANLDTYDTASGAGEACAAIGRDPENATAILDWLQPR